MLCCFILCSFPLHLCWFVLVITCFLVLKLSFDLALVISILLKLFLISYLVFISSFPFLFSLVLPSSCFLRSILFCFLFVYFCLSCVFVLSCLVIVFCPVLPLPRFPGLWPLLPGSRPPLPRVKSLVLRVPTWRLDWCDFWDSLQATLSSCLALPLELPPPCLSPLPSQTDSVVIPPARSVLSALPLCLDWFTFHSPSCF